MLKLKLDENGKAVLDANGNPIYVREDGSEFVADINQMHSTITRLTGESKSFREKKEELEAKLQAFNNIDPVKAKEAIETVASIDQKKLIDAGKLDEVKEQIKKEYDAKIAELEAKNTDSEGKYNNLVRSNAFSRSKFITDKIAVPVDMIEATFGSNFKIENGKLVGYQNGNQIMSKKNIGEIADFDESLEILVNGYSNKDMILKGSGNSGGGTNGGGTNGNGGKRVISRADFNKLQPAEQAATMKDVRENKAVLQD